MRTHNMPFINIRKENHHKLSQICMGYVFSLELKNEFETAVVNERSVFEPLKFYCICIKAEGLDPLDERNIPKKRK